MNRLTDLQIARNESGQDAWNLVRAHRERVAEELVRGVSSAAARLCVLGAGNCNDLDLARLTETFFEVHLSDLDAAAVEAGVARQAPARSDRISVHGGLDITGVWDRLAAWTPDRPASDADVDALLVEWDKSPRLNLPGPFDLVASVGLLSQLIEAVVVTMGEQHPRFEEVIVALRRNHLRRIIDLTAVGGYGLLITDFVSSDTLPELPVLADESLSAVLMQALHGGNFFHGVNPFAIEAACRNDPALSPHIGTRQVLQPWRWNIGSRVYAVTGLKFQRQ